MRPAIVSLDIRTHVERFFPLRDLAGISPDGHRITFVTRTGDDEYQLRVRRLDGSHDHVLVRTPFPIAMGRPRWSPDGRTIAYLRFNPACTPGPPACHGAVQLWLVRPAGGAPRLLSDDAEEAAWSPESRRLAFPAEVDAAAGLARLTVIDVDGSDRVAFGSATTITSLSWTPDDTEIVLYSTNSGGFPQFGNGVIHAVDVANGTDRLTAAGIDPRSSADGLFLSFIRWTTRGTALVIRHYARARTVLRRKNFGFAHTWSRHGHLLALAATNRYGQSRIFLYNPDLTRPLRPLTRWTYGPVRSIAWSPDGRHVLFARSAS